MARAARSSTNVRTWFPQLWAIAILFHLAGNPWGLLAPGQAVFWVELPMAVIALVVFVRPRLGRWIGLVAALQLIDLWLDAPQIGNHALVLGLVNLTILGALAIEAVRRNRRRDESGGPAESDGWLVVFAPAGRAVLLTFYIFAAFTKLNSDFVDLTTSCAVEFANELAWWVGGTFDSTPVLPTLIIWGTLIGELAVPVLLWRKPSIGVPFAMGLHLLFAIEPVGHVYDFSSMLIPLFLLFTGADFDKFFAERWTKVRRRVATLGAIVGVAGVGLLALGSPAIILLAYPAWLLYGISMLRLVIGHVRSTTSVRDGAPVVAGLHPVLAIVVVLALVNGVSPYLELKTNFGFNMYSNLRTEDGDSNHFLIRATLPLRDQQRNVVEIIDSSDEELIEYREDGLGLTYDALRTYLANNPDVSIHYRYQGVEVDLDRAADRPELVEPPSLLARKIGAYRAIDLDESKGCLRTWGAAH